MSSAPYVLELFKGGGSIGKCSKKHWKYLKVISLDMNEGYEPTICIDFLEWDYKKFFKKNPNIVCLWSSPPCETFSIAAHGVHRVKGTAEAKTKSAEKADRVVDKLLDVIDYLPKGTPWFIENPRGALAKYISHLEKYKHTVYYCQYGFKYRKATHIWTNSKHFNPEGIKCNHGKHETNIQKIHSIVERYCIPEKLCDEIVKCFLNV